jgi:YD repeat-containing protein
MSATSGTATTTYNYDPFGRLDTVTSGTAPPLERNIYDGFDNIATYYQGGTRTDYSYDPLNRVIARLPAPRPAATRTSACPPT